MNKLFVPVPVKNSGRQISFDVMKLLAAYMVVFYHCSLVNRGYFNEGIYTISMGQVILCFCSASIPLFFMVNGAFALNKKYSVDRAYGKAAKIALLLVFWTLFRWMDFDVPSWFLRTLTILYLLYPILLKIYENKIARYLSMCLIFGFPFLYNFIMVLLKYGCPQIQISLFNHVLTLNNIPSRTGAWTMYSILYFFLGAVLYDKRLKKYISILFVLLGYSLVVFDVIVSSNYSQSVQDPVNACFPTIGALLIAVGLFCILRECENIDNKYFRAVVLKLGHYVLSIYIFHMFLMKILFKLYLLITGGNYHTFTLGVSVFFVLLIYILCCLLGYVMSKLPLLKNLVKV